MKLMMMEVGVNVLISCANQVMDWYREIYMRFKNKASKGVLDGLKYTEWVNED